MTEDSTSHKQYQLSVHRPSVQDLETESLATPLLVGFTSNASTNILVGRHTNSTSNHEGEPISLCEMQSNDSYINNQVLCKVS